jgi:hypothetical protein
VHDVIAVPHQAYDVVNISHTMMPGGQTDASR